MIDEASDTDEEDNASKTKNNKTKDGYTAINDLSKHMDRDEVAWQSDAYGFLTFSIIRFCANHDLGTQYKEATTYAFAIVLYIMVIGMQGVITGFLMLSGSQLERKTENDYFMAHYGVDMPHASAKLLQAAANKEALTTKVLNDLHCEAGVGDHYLCSCHEQLKVQLPVFYIIMISVWTFKMLNEFKAAIWSIIYVTGTPLPKEKKVEVQRSKEDESQITKITHLSTAIKAFILFVDPVVRLIVACALTFAGAKFLLLQTDQSKLVMKVLTMQFVTQVDDFLYGSLVTKKASEEVKKSKLCTDYGSPKRNTWWENGLGSSIYLVISLVFVWIFTEVFFHDLTNFRASCRIYRNAMQDSKFGLGNRTSVTAMLLEILQ